MDEVNEATQEIKIHISGDIGAGKTILGIFLRKILILMGAKVTYTELDKAKGKPYSEKINKEIVKEVNDFMFSNDMSLSFNDKIVDILVD